MKLYISQRVPFQYDRASWVDIVSRIEQQGNSLAEGRLDARHNAASAAPSAGVYAVGDIVWNNAPAAGGFIGWVCVDDDPLTFKGFGEIEA